MNQLESEHSYVNYPAEITQVLATSRSKQVTYLETALPKFTTGGLWKLVKLHCPAWCARQCRRVGWEWTATFMKGILSGCMVPAQFLILLQTSTVIFYAHFPGDSINYDEKVINHLWVG